MSNSLLDYGPAPESDADARAWLTSHNNKFGHFINGKFTAPSKKQFKTIEPATGKVLASLSLGGQKEITAAVAAAKKAQVNWFKAKGHTRAKVLYAFARLIQRNARLFAVLETLDNGKPVRETRDVDVPLAARHFYHHAGWAQLQESKFAAYEPVGVCAQIVPWNFPLLMLAWKIAPALALGNTVVLKPAEQTPLSALLFAELAKRAGMPDGILNIVTGDGSTGALLTKAKGIAKIAFTGSTEVGRSIRKQSAGSGQSLTLELGGKSPFIVFDDADLDAAVEGIVDGVWFNQGQVCCAGSRLIIQEGVADLFHKKLATRQRTMRIGDPLDKNTDVGAIISPEQHQRISEFVKIGVADGAKLYQAKLNKKDQASKRFFAPTLLANIPQASKAAIEEIFGPVLVSTTFRTSAEAVVLANNSRYGLAASIYSENLGLALDVAPKIKAGVVWVNSTNLFDASVGFGGYRESGFGREGGIEGCLAYLKPLNLFSSKLRNDDKVVKVKTTQVQSGIDRTAKNFIGGKQKRPDGGYSYPVFGSKNEFIAEAAKGNRKDIRDAVAQARSNDQWSKATSHARSQVLYYIAENLAIRKQEFAKRLVDTTSIASAKANSEVDKSINRLFSYAAWCDKYEGRVHEPPVRGVALAMNEPLGVVGVACPNEEPLLSLVSLIGPLLATGNRIVVLPSELHPFTATDLYQVFETSDLPAGAVNLVTGNHDELIEVLAGHLDVDAMWTFGSAKQSKQTEKLSAGNLKRTFVDQGRMLDWSTSEGEQFLTKAVQVKNIWIPYGD